MRIAIASSDESRDSWLEQHMVNSPRRINARCAWDEEEKSDQTVLTAVWSASESVSMDCAGVSTRPMYHRIYNISLEVRN